MQKQEPLDETIQKLTKRLAKSLRGNRLQLLQLKRFKQEYEDLDKKLTELPSKLKHDIMVPISSIAFMPGYLVNTNKVTVHLGDDWFTKCSTEQAKSIIGRRNQFIEEKICALTKEFEDLKARLGLTPELLEPDDDLVEIKEPVEEEIKELKIPGKESSENPKKKPKIEILSENDDDSDPALEKMKAMIEMEKQKAKQKNLSNQNQKNFFSDDSMIRDPNLEMMERLEKLEEESLKQNKIKLKKEENISEFESEPLSVEKKEDLKPEKKTNIVIPSWVFAKS